MTQYMTPEDGKRRLREMIEAVKALMRVNGEWRSFVDMLDVAYPRFDAIKCFRSTAFFPVFL